MVRLHASAIAIDGKAVLLRGPSGVGKSDLALRLMDEGAVLVADDYVELTAADGHILLNAPTNIQGQMEVRGIGLIERPFAENVPLLLVCDLVVTGSIDRLPEKDSRFHMDDISVRLIQLEGLLPSAPAKIRTLLSLLSEESPSNVSA